MKIVPFLSERLLSIWQNQVRYDFTETGVHPLHLHEFLTREEYNAHCDDINGMGAQFCARTVVEILAGLAIRKRVR